MDRNSLDIADLVHDWLVGPGVSPVLV